MTDRVQGTRTLFGDWLGVAVFSVNGTLISLMSGAMHRARARATRAKEQAEAANKAKSVFLSAGESSKSSGN
jgi:hypothetical protein